MKRLAVNLVIVSYLGALAWGVVAHAVKYKVASHPAMYYVVWDMFCGWSAYASRTQIIAEGESGRHYEVAPAPWGELKPFGHIERRHYDPFDDLMGKLIRNNLRRTTHEPIGNVYIVEEIWPKKFNLPDDIWARRFDTAKNPQRYYNVKSVFNSEGMKIQMRPCWDGLQRGLAVADNPRLQQQARGATPFMTIGQHGRRGQPGPSAHYAN